ncbi:MAG: iron-sulfur cluster assembly accessory protein [Geminocystis sp.]|nr:iron-sulfur cluster assembly accessory protein [Geminocystis sp.]MCS7148361.1 iron-sulfur cluster assembly accessory protein [Geminocystis sp.]MDW8116051.1 iron-sulfur cluster assembly accessory protein [Geminocystis sp.]
MAGPNPQPPMVNITQRALAELKRLKNSQLNQEKPYLRVELVKGGCLDYIYNLRFDSHIKDSDVTLTHPSGITIVTDYDSYPHVEGLTIDYLEDLMGGSFQFKGVTMARQCTCGLSFCLENGTGTTEKS